ncbi:MAG TPA: nucleoside-diphosphate kinase [Paludibacter sp.]|jgi:nucleoside-diphosphate kinase|nr:nucleoside-diphosphate kinase [Paludibacter sp.]
MERTLVIIKPCAIRRGLIGEVIQRFERRGLQLSGMKMVQLNEEALADHYAHLVHKPYYQRIVDSMMLTPVIVCCWTGIDAVHIAHVMAGATNGREAAPGTIRGDYSVSVQENILHTSDTIENGKIEIARFFSTDEVFEFEKLNKNVFYANDEF